MTTRKIRAQNLTTRDMLVEHEIGARGGTGKRVGRPICELFINEVTGVVNLRVRVEDRNEPRGPFDIRDWLRVVA